MKFQDVDLNWLGHSGFLIENSISIYVDPYNIPEDSEKADIILITHSHYDHCSVKDIGKIIKPNTKIIMPADCQSKMAHFDIPVDIEIIEIGQELQFSNGKIKISAIPAYNIDKHFHPKETEWIGYVIKMGKVIIYHAGDTDVIPEMQKLTGYKQKEIEFIALLPVGGRFTMSAEEAVEAVKMIKPSVAIPMHYGSVVGTRDDAKEFKDLCEEEGFKVEILEKQNKY